MALHLNPLTSGAVVDRANGPVLTLRSFAPGRSYRGFDVARADQPEAFDFLVAWLDGAQPKGPPPFDPTVRAAAMLHGLLLSNEEIGLVPDGAAPDLSDGHEGAATLCPEVAGFLADAPALPVLPPGLADDLAERNFAELPAMLGEPSLAALRHYYRTLSDGGWTRFDKGQSGRRVIHGDPVGRRVLDLLTPLIAQISGREVKPSYCFAAEYREGDELPRHTDRPQCEYTVSLFVDHRPGKAGADCPWPLVIHAPDGDVVMRQAAGGGPVFRGRSLPHSRPPLGKGQRSQMLFLHYVHADFTGPLD